MCTTRPQVCGDGFVEAPEQCDLGNLNGTGQGCNANCQFDCQQDSDCSDGNTCNGTETCASSMVMGETVQKCAAGMNEAACTACASGYCDGNGTCNASTCGDGCVDPSTEQCDFGSGNNVAGSGCEPTCQFSCTTNPNSCDNGNVCDGLETCGDVTGPNGGTGQACSPGTPPPDGTSCGGSLVCEGGMCTTRPQVCGDGFVESPEQCDLGNLNGTGQGCNSSCQFDCQHDTDCADNNTCNGTEACVSSMFMGETVQTCQPGTNEAACASCSGGFCDGNGQCAASACGDGCVDTSAGEQCDLGSANGTGQGCNASCQYDCQQDSDCSDGNVCNGTETCVSGTVSGETVQTCQAGTNVAACTACSSGFCNSNGQCEPSTCGDGCLDPATEQCDDGNTYDLDGCDSTCHYETITRFTSLAISGSAAPSFCTPTTNALGTHEIASVALSSLNSPIQSGVDSGSTNILMQFVGLLDLTGTAATGLSLGVVNASIDPAKGTWSGTSPIDWWFLAGQGTVSAGLPVDLMPATLVSNSLSAGPGDISLAFSFGAGTQPIRMKSAHIAATINSGTDVPAPPPSALAPNLTAFETITASGANQGLCGNMTVESLAAIPIAQAITSSGSNSCACGSPTYTYCGDGKPVGPNCNSLLDVLVGGCVVKTSFLGCVFGGTTAIAAGQPDVAANGGTVTHLSLGANNKVPTSATNGDEDGYSSYMTFGANRAHFTGQVCTANTDCQTGQTCNSGTCK
jgi:cysteine-rich repeat protein